MDCSLRSPLRDSLASYLGRYTATRILSHRVMLRRPSLFAMATLLTFGIPSRHVRSQESGISPTIVVSLSERRWSSIVALKVFVRDVDDPGVLISDVQILMRRGVDPDPSPVMVTADNAGTANFVARDSGEYRLTLRRIGYDRLDLRIRLGAECGQILEAYIARAVTISEPPLVTAGKETKRKRSASRTVGRAVLTTCPPAA